MGIVLKLALLLAVTQGVFGENLNFISSDQQTTLIELYSSEGCSSCPPADQFLSQFSNSNDLWNQYIPVAFHVDYWDYIGWKDAFASADFSNRHQALSVRSRGKGGYVPGNIAELSFRPRIGERRRRPWSWGFVWHRSLRRWLSS